MITDKLYGLIGFENPIEAVNDFPGFVLGVGYTLKKVSFELGYKEARKAPMANIIFRF